MNRLAIIGAGSWGTALGIALAPRFETVQLWARSQMLAAEMQSQRTNTKYLPDVKLPPAIAVSTEIAAVVSNAEVVLMAVPSTHMRELLASVRPHLIPGVRVVSATKGIEEDTLCRMSEIASEVLSPALSTPITVLSGPTFSREVAAGEPAAVVIASTDPGVAREMQRVFSTEALRFYASTDVVGVEIGAAVKNVIAIGAGVCDGLGLGSNSIAALITRGLAEITRLAVTLGGEPRTLSGLAGLGDLVLTATGALSRNRHVGVQLGRGRRLQEILSEMTMVAEGVSTCRAARQLGIRSGVDLPIVNEVYAVLYENKDPQTAIRQLMERPLTSE